MKTNHLPKTNIKNKSVREKSQVLGMQHFQGPIPPPALLEEYRRIIPDAPERILRMAEKNSDHLIELDKKKLQTENSQIKRGQIFALITVILIILLSGYALYSHYPSVAAILAGLDLVGLVIAFIFGRKEKRKSFTGTMSNSAH